MTRPLRIAVASGKGGTGKTTLATNLAVALSRSGARVAYLDCDVEEPNGHLFLRTEATGRRDVTVPVPEVDAERCTLCGACAEACRYSAIVALPNKVLTYPKLCHGCGGCAFACPEEAIREVPRATGVVETGHAGALGFVQGRLTVGEAMAPPVVRAVLGAAPEDAVLVIDAPPGTSCPVIESVKGADVVLLVTEPTPFGLNDLKLAVELVRELGLPFGVAINRAGSGDEAVLRYCAEERIPVLFELFDDLAVARAYSRGELAIDARPELEARFVRLYDRLVDLSQTRPARRRSRSSMPAGGLSFEAAGGAPVAAGLTSPAGGAPGAAGLPSETVALGRKKQEVRELVVISGKGGTGKTSIVASLFSLAKQAAVADCDVDAADLHLVLSPEVRGRWPFSGGSVAAIDPERCTGCGICADHCRFDAIRREDGRTDGAGDVLYAVETVSCEGCGVCTDVCPQGAAALAPTVNGEWFVSETRHGPMVHARLGIAQENSGKLVSLVRREAAAVAGTAGRPLLICDGSPGIGCPVIASVTGAGLALLVTEPTLSGLHDLGRVAELCRQLRVRAAVCVNKADINPEMATRIEAEAARWELPVLGRVRYDTTISAAQVARRPAVEHGGRAAEDIRALWSRLGELLDRTPGA